MVTKINSTMVIFCHDEWRNFETDTLLERFLVRMKRVLCVHNHVVCTNVDSLVPMALKAGYKHISLGLEAGWSGQDFPAEFKTELARKLRYALGGVGNIQLGMDAKYLLVRSETIEDMFDLLMEDGQYNEVSLASAIDPHLFVKNGESVHQIYDHPNVDRQKLPQIFRRAQVVMRHGLRPVLSSKNTEFLKVPWAEIMPYTPQYHDFFDEQSVAMEV